MAEPTSTPYTNVPHIVSSQQDHEITANEAFDDFDGMINGKLDVTITTADITLTEEEALRNAVFVIGGALTASRNLIVPDNMKKYDVIHLGTGGYTVTVKTVAGTGVQIDENTARTVYCDGTNVIALTGASQAGGTHYDILVFIPNKPDSGDVIFGAVFKRDIRFAAGLPGSGGKSQVAATGSSTFTIRKNGSSIGTLVFAAAASTPTITFSSQVDFLASVPDVMTITAPSPQDGTLEDIAFTIIGTEI